MNTINLKSRDAAPHWVNDGPTLFVDLPTAERSALCSINGGKAWRVVYRGGSFMSTAYYKNLVLKGGQCHQTTQTEYDTTWCRAPKTRVDSDPFSHI
jgi:hypothetical protein